MAKTKNLREALLGSSKSAIEAGRSSVAGVADSAGAVWLPVADIAPDPDQPRTHYDEAAMRALAESIAALGQIEPIVVQALGAAERASHDGRRYRCLSGHRRLRAHESLGLSEIRATVVRERLSESDRFRHEIASNEVREDHTDFDRARFMALVFAEALGAEGDDAARTERVKYVVNRAFNELDRAGELSAESAEAVATCERALAGRGERR
jgi:ParB/RepB/Spo0J family partition protein